MILARERWAGKVPEEKSINLRWSGVPVLETFFTSFHRERSEVAVRESPEGRLPNPDYGYRSHIISL